MVLPVPERHPLRVLFGTLCRKIHAGTAKLGGFVHARLLRLATGTHSDRRFRLDERLEDLALAKRTLEYLPDGR